MPRIVVDEDLCQGHGVCADEAPEVFRLDADEHVQVLLPEPPPEQLEAVRTACRYCPTGAIQLVEDT